MRSRVKSPCFIIMGVPQAPWTCARALFLSCSFVFTLRNAHELDLQTQTLRLTACPYRLYSGSTRTGPRLLSSTFCCEQQLPRQRRFVRPTCRKHTRTHKTYRIVLGSYQKVDTNTALGVCVRARERERRATGDGRETGDG